MSNKKSNVVRGDVVYFNHPDHGAMSGEVVCIGADGVTVSGEGEDHNVVWTNILGHKSRKERNLTLIERGEDGAIATDEDGNRVYVDGDVPGGEEEQEEPEEDLTKSLPFNEPISLRDQAAIDAVLITAGLSPSLEYIRATYGDHWSFPPSVRSFDDSVIIKEIATLREDMEASIRHLRSEVIPEVS